MESSLGPAPSADGVDSQSRTHHLQWLFSAPIQTAELFAEVHPGQASFVWHVVTSTEDAIVRTSRLQSSEENSFWQGCRELFGVIPTEVEQMQSINRFLSMLSLIPIPEVLKVAYSENTPYLLVQRMDGQSLSSFQKLSLSTTYEFGRSQALLHQRGKRDVFGAVIDTSRQHSVSQFGQRLADTMEAIALQHFSMHRDIRSRLSDMQKRARELTISEACPIMMDMDPTQYLCQQDDSNHFRISALVDTEVYVLGPSELELVALEYLLDREHAVAFRQGYTSVREFPPLDEVRSLYRYFCLLIEIQGAMDFETWMNWPVQFSD